MENLQHVKLWKKKKYLTKTFIVFNKLLYSSDKIQIINSIFLLKFWIDEKVRIIKCSLSIQNSLDVWFTLKKVMKIKTPSEFNDKSEGVS